MSCQPQLQITPAMLARVEAIAALRAHGSLSPREVGEGIGISRQGAMNLLRPLVKVGLVKRVGTLKTGRYILFTNWARGGSCRAATTRPRSAGVPRSGPTCHCAFHRAVAPLFASPRDESTRESTRAPG